VHIPIPDFPVKLVLMVDLRLSVFCPLYSGTRRESLKAKSRAILATKYAVLNQNNFVQEFRPPVQEHLFHEAAKQPRRIDAMHDVGSHCEPQRRSSGTCLWISLFGSGSHAGSRDVENEVE